MKGIDSTYSFVNELYSQRYEPLIKDKQIPLIIKGICGHHPDTRKWLKSVKHEFSVNLMIDNIDW